MKTETLVLTAVLTALVVVFYIISLFVMIGPAQLNLTLIPVVIGGIMCGRRISAWLGFVSAVTVLVSPATALFYGWHVLGTIVTVLLKGCISGYVAGLVFELVGKSRRYLGILLSAMTCPIVNTGIFILGSLIFFKADMESYYSELMGNGFMYFLLFVFIGWNFIVEFGGNVLLSPTISKIVDLRKKK